MIAQKFVYYGFHSLIFQYFPASRMCQHEGSVTVIGRLRPRSDADLFMSRT